MAATGTIAADELRRRVDAGEVHTVLLVFVDLQGRLQGKRCSGRYFVDEVLVHGSSACDYLLAVNVEMEPQTGFALSGWEQGYGDFALVPDPATVRPAGWRDGTVVCFADAVHRDGTPVAPSPRQVLRRQLDRLAARGWTARVATELEFIVHRESYDEAWRRGYRDLTPGNRYNVDYSMFGSAELDPFLDRLIRVLHASGIGVETVKGEANLGQHEVNLRHQEALAAADAHAFYKHAVKEAARAEGLSATFMAKWNKREGNSCHVHFSLVDADGRPVFQTRPELLDRFVAGQLAAQRELLLAFAPNVNSYKRYTAGSFAPTAIAWGEDNRTCAVRVLGSGAGRRFENRVAGADVNPYLLVAAVVAAGLHGVDGNLPLPPAETSNAYLADHERLPAGLGEAVGLFRASRVATEAFGADVVAHYVRAAEVELADFSRAVTDWEKFRGYERL
ncbi:gamma-glutamylethanolamide synthetase GlnA4 [Dactylosporangium fulvum]|uniref:Glutamine synthetase family protein n=1 Tax=Dactylosporangium fulvum TaxID=53359 RepID=A0ABY5VR71_9ACTN|nr:glutamine synthetase family protein [Dactylosporangium fulvum]UWP78988.1 glutamine synthetase family protein [Dactylosporangium fulvum]